MAATRWRCPARPIWCKQNAGLAPGGGRVCLRAVPALVERGSDLAPSNVNEATQNPEIVFTEIGLDQIDLIQPLWEKLNQHNAALSPHFPREIGRRTFAPRKRELWQRGTSGKLKIDLVRVRDQEAPAAYCVSTLTGDFEGEIDSLYVDEGFRGIGIGSELTKRSLQWLDSVGAKSKFISVTYGNDEAVRFYARFGFLPRSFSLYQSRLS